jgi:hypothetical protein
VDTSDARQKTGGYADMLTASRSEKPAATRLLLEHTPDFPEGKAISAAPLALDWLQIAAEPSLWNKQHTQQRPAPPPIVRIA